MFEVTSFPELVEKAEQGSGVNEAEADVMY